MAFGILEPVENHSNVPGTSLLEDLALHDTENDTANLKKGTGKNRNVVLVPQPSNDPNDPLNWPLWQRDCIILLYCYSTVIGVGGVGPVLGVMGLPLVKDFNITFTQVSLLTGFQLCAVGAIAVFISAASQKYGRRPLFVTSTAILVAGSLWCAAAQSYESMVGARILQGVGAAIFESITFAVVGDLYCVHQRGARMAIATLAQSGLLPLPSLIAGKVAEDLGWRWVFWILSIFLGTAFIGIALFGWESAYKRTDAHDRPASPDDDAAKGKKLQTDKIRLEEIDPRGVQSTTATASREPLIARLKLWSTTYSSKPFLVLCIEPLGVLLSPIVVWAALIIAFAQLWNIIINYIIVQIFATPPYNLQTDEISYITAGPMVAGLLGCWLCGYLSDRIAKYMSRRNNGVFEAEFRLILMIGVPVTCSIGYFGFGNLVAQGTSPVASSVLWGVAYVSVQLTGNAVGSYLIDAFRSHSVQIFTISMAIRNFIFFGFSFFMNDWIATWGPAKAFNCIGGIMLALTATTVLVYVYGKRHRTWWYSRLDVKIE